MFVTKKCLDICSFTTALWFMNLKFADVVTKEIGMV